MKLISAALVLGLGLLASPARAQKSSRPPAQFTQRVQREVMHQILMLPYYDVFDAIGFKVEGYNVTLFGRVTRPSLKDDAARVVKKIEGVERVNNQIEVLPASFFDDDIRRRMFRAIYGYGPLQRYALPPIKPIRIIVDRGHVTLEGVVDSQGDKNLVNIRANGVPGVFSVTNHLIVAQEKSSRKAQK
jgi:hyperosmotically inducible periplasmic protein